MIRIPLLLALLTVASGLPLEEGLAGDATPGARADAKPVLGLGTSVGNGIVGGALLVPIEDSVLWPEMSLPGVLLKIGRPDGFRVEFEFDVVRPLVFAALGWPPSYGIHVRWLGVTQRRPFRFTGGVAFTPRIGSRSGTSGPVSVVIRVGPALGAEGVVGREERGRIGFLVEPGLYVVHSPEGGGLAPVLVVGGAAILLFRASLWLSPQRVGTPAVE